MGATHQTLPTPDPQRRALAVTVTASTLVSHPFILPPRGTLYSDFPETVFSSDYNENFGGYRYTDQAPNAENGDAVLLFAPGMTEEERQTPFNTTEEYGNHYWHPILKSLVFIEDKSFPLSTSGGDGDTINGYQHYAREVYIPPAKEGTRFVYEEFISDIVPAIPQYEAPLPTRVSYDFLSVRGSFPECLHDRINLNAQKTTIPTFSTDPTAAAGALQGQQFPATNFITWEPYVISHKPQFRNGVWYHIRVTAYPPNEPETIVQ